MAISTHVLYDGAVEIVKNETRHTYTLNGKYLPSSTGVTGMLNKDLAKWGAKMAAEVFQKRVDPGRGYDEVAIRRFSKEMEEAPKNYMDDAAEIGNLAHDWIHEYVKLQIAGKLYDDVPRPVNQMANKAIESFLKFAEQHDIKWLHSERVVYYGGPLDRSGLIYCGTADIICELDGVPTVLDWKSGKHVYREHGLQAASYCAAAGREFGTSPQRAIVHIPARTGKLDFWDEKRITDELTGGDLEKDFAIFMTLLHVYRWHQKNQYYWQKKYQKKRS